MVSIRFLGHACFAIDANFNGNPLPIRLVIDPFPRNVFENALNLNALEDILPTLPPVSKTFVTVSHNHADHNGVDAVPNGIIDFEPNPFHICKVMGYHDEYSGQRFGGEVQLIHITMDTPKLIILHLGDIGSSPTPELIDEIGEVDILFIPIGGFYTIGYGQALEWIERLHPKSVVPMHYLHRGGRLPISPLKPFLDFIPYESTQRTEVLESRELNISDNHCRIINLRPLAEKP